MREFINILGTRVRLSRIQKYKQVKVDNELFIFKSEEDLKITVLELDQNFL